MSYEVEHGVRNLRTTDKIVEKTVLLYCIISISYFRLSYSQIIRLQIQADYHKQEEMIQNCFRQI